MKPAGVANHGTSVEGLQLQAAVIQGGLGLGVGGQEDLEPAVQLEAIHLICANPACSTEREVLRRRAWLRGGQVQTGSRTDEQDLVQLEAMSTTCTHTGPATLSEMHYANVLGCVGAKCSRQPADRELHR